MFWIIWQRTTKHWFTITCALLCLSPSVMFDSLWPHGLLPAKLLCPQGFSRQEYWSELLCPSPGDLPNPGIKPRSPTMQEDSLLTEPLEKPFEMITWFLSLSWLMWCITLIDLHILKNPWIWGIKPSWSRCMIFLMCCWVQLANILLRIFASMFISDTGL